MAVALARATTRVHKDEPAACLVERNRVAPDPANPDVHHARRFQVITVNRDGELADYTTDLGPADDFKSQEFQILGVWEHSVAELQDMADRERWREDHWQKFLAEKQAESTLQTDYRNWVEERRNIFDNRTQIGPGLRKQRNGFSRKGVLEWHRRQ